MKPHHSFVCTLYIFLTYWPFTSIFTLSNLVHNSLLHIILTFLLKTYINYTGTITKVFIQFEYIFFFLLLFLQLHNRASFGLHNGPFPFTLTLACFSQNYIFINFISRSTLSSHLILGLPLGLKPTEFLFRNFLTKPRFLHSF